VTLDELIARESIRDLVARYNVFGDAGDVAQVADLFAEDAALEVGDRSRGQVFRGRTEIRDFLDAVKTHWAASPALPRSGSASAFVRHCLATHVIDFQPPDAADGTCYLIVMRSGRPPASARYLDRYGIRDGRWVFVSRRALADGESGAASLLAERAEPAP
jgi:hypothetical protein